MCPFEVITRIYVDDYVPMLYEDEDTFSTTSSWTPRRLVFIIRPM